MVKLLSLASSAVVALALTPSGASAASARALLAEAAPSPAAAPMAAATPMMDLTLAAEGISFAGGKLIVKDPAETLIKRRGDAIGLAPTEATFSKVNAPSEAVILGTAADGSPLTAIARLSNPSMKDDDLTFDAVILAKPDAGSAGAITATAAKAGPSLVSPATPEFKAKTAAIVFEGDAAPAEQGGEKGLIGAVVGAGVGGALCGPLCAAGGAWTGAWVG